MAKIKTEQIEPKKKLNKIEAEAKRQEKLNKLEDITVFQENTLTLKQLLVDFGKVLVQDDKMRYVRTEVDFETLYNAYMNGAIIVNDKGDTIPKDKYIYLVGRFVCYSVLRFLDCGVSSTSEKIYHDAMEAYCNGDKEKYKQIVESVKNGENVDFDAPKHKNPTNYGNTTSTYDIINAMFIALKCDDYSDHNLKDLIQEAVTNTWDALVCSSSAENFTNKVRDIIRLTRGTIDNAKHKHFNNKSVFLDFRNSAEIDARLVHLDALETALIQDETLTSEAWERVEKMIAELALSRQQLTALVYALNGRSHTSIAELMGIKETTVRDYFKRIELKARKSSGTLGTICTLASDNDTNADKVKIADKCNRDKIAVIVRKGDAVIGSFSGINECARALGIDSCNIKKCLKGTRKTAGGYTFTYLDGHNTRTYKPLKAYKPLAVTFSDFDKSAYTDCKNRDKIAHAITFNNGKFVTLPTIHATAIVGGSNSKIAIAKLIASDIRRATAYNRVARFGSATTATPKHDAPINGGYIPMTRATATTTTTATATRPTFQPWIYDLFHKAN